MKKNYFIFIVIVYCLDAGTVSSAQEAGRIDQDTLKSSISANQALIRRFSLEHEELLKKQGQPPAEKLDLKLADLKNKIAVLKNANERLMYVLSESSKPQPVPTAKPQNLTGKDWLGMNKKDKEMYLFSTMGALVKKDVLTIKPSHYYMESLDKLIAHDASYKGKSLDDTLILIIYKNEPDTRGAINTFRKITDSELQKI